MSFLINSYAYATGGGADVTPDAISSSYEIAIDIYGESYTNIYFKIQGISTSITIKAVITDLGANGALYYLKKSTEPIFEQSNARANWSTPPTQLTNNGTFSISNGEWVVFTADSTDNASAFFDVNLLNASDGDALLTQINVNVSYP